MGGMKEKKWDDFGVFFFKPFFLFLPLLII